MTNEPFVPALHYRWITPVYDALLRWLLPEAKLKRLLVKQAHPDAQVVG